MDTCKSDLINHLQFEQYRFLHGKCFCTIFMHSFVFTKLTRSQSLARRFVKTNSCVNIVRQHFPWRNLYICSFRYYSTQRCHGNLPFLGGAYVRTLNHIITTWRDVLFSYKFCFSPLLTNSFFFSLNLSTDPVLRFKDPVSFFGLLAAQVWLLVPPFIKSNLKLLANITIRLALGRALYFFLLLIAHFSKHKKIESNSSWIPGIGGWDAFAKN